MAQSTRTHELMTQNMRQSFVYFGITELCECYEFFLCIYYIYMVNEANSFAEKSAETHNFELGRKDVYTNRLCSLANTVNTLHWRSRNVGAAFCGILFIL